MNSWRCWLLFLWITILHETVGTCVGDDECNWGVCEEDGLCNCLPLFEGEECTRSWLDSSHLYNVAFQSYAALEILFQIVVSVFAGYQLWLTWRLWRQGTIACLSVTTWILIIIIVAGTLRIAEFAVDPHAAKRLYSVPVEEMLFNIPVVLWMIAGYMLIFYWVELQDKSSIQRLSNVKKLRPVLICFALFAFFFLIPAAIWESTSHTFVSKLVYNFFFIVCTFTAMTLSLVYGIKLLRAIKSVWNDTKIRTYQMFLKKLTYYILVLAGVLFSIVVTVGLFVALNASEDKWLYLLIHALLRIEEFVMIFITLLFMAKKKPAKIDDQSPSSLTAGGKSNSSFYTASQMQDKDKSAELP